MRARRVLALLVVVAATGLLSGGAAGAAPTAAALVATAIEVLPGRIPAEAIAAAPAVLDADGGTGSAGPASLADAPAAADPPLETPPEQAASVEASPPEQPAEPAAEVPAEAPAEPSGAAPTDATAPVVEEPAAAEPPEASRLVAGTPCVRSARACIELSSNRAWLIRGGAVSYGPVPITHGRKGYRTPAGTFSVTYRDRHHVSSIYDAPMPYSVFFNGGIAFHQGSLQQKSHGCVHLSRTAAREFFDTLRRGDVVQVVR